MGAPKIPDAPNPAVRPERVVEVQPEDIELGEADDTTADTNLKGKRSLSKPTGGTAASGLAV